MKRFSIILALAAALFAGTAAEAQADTPPDTPEYYQVDSTGQQHGDTGFVYEYAGKNGRRQVSETCSEDNSGQCSTR